MHVESGYGYGVVGADIHVFQDRGPVYLLAEHRPQRRETDAESLLKQPSRLLTADYQVVDFTGRDQDRSALEAWRDHAGPRLSARWLHAPGGQGKTRLAAEFAADSATAGWKVATATHGPGAIMPSPGSQDMRLGNATGLLLIVDYADRWPLSHLTWLFSNALFHHRVPTRLLLLARSAQSWPTICSALTKVQAATSDHLLLPIATGRDLGERQRMFTVARDCFARRFGITDPTAIEPPGSLQHPDFGLVLALHMAALVAVDAQVRENTAPEDMAGLSAYLLNREREYWEHLYGNGIEGMDFQTPRSVMARTVFTAALTGATTHPLGTAVLDSLNLEVHTSRLLTDHSVCYPPADAAAVLEPLYPDRLAEDFLALMLPGHSITSSPADPWAKSALNTLTKRLPEGDVPAYIARALTFLAAAAAPGRWPHVAQHLNTLLQADPLLGVAAGSSTLTALAEVPAIETSVLQAVASFVPRTGVPDLDPGIADLTSTLAARLLDQTDEAAERARIYADLAYRLANAGRQADALTAAQNTVDAYIGADLRAYGYDFAHAVHNLGASLYTNGRYQEAVAQTTHAVELRRILDADGTARSAHDLALSLGFLATQLAPLGKYREALETCAEAESIWRRLATSGRASGEPRRAAHSAANLADCLVRLSNAQANVGLRPAALAAVREAVEIYKGLIPSSPVICNQLHDHSHDFERELEGALTTLGDLLIAKDQARDALEPLQRAVALNERLTEANPDVYESRLADSLSNLAIVQAMLHLNQEAAETLGKVLDTYERLAEQRGRALYEPDIARVLNSLSPVLAALGNKETALEKSEQSVAAYRRLASSNPARYEPELASALNNLGQRRSGMNLHQKAVESVGEAVQIRRRLTAAQPAAHEPRLARALTSLGQVQAAAGALAEALESAEEARARLRRWVEAEPEAYTSLLNMVEALVAQIRHRTAG